MGNNAFKTTIQIIKYVSLIFLIVTIFLNTDLFPKLCSGFSEEINEFLKNSTDFIRTNIKTTSVILLVCLIIYLLCNFFLRIIEFYTESNELDKIDSENIKNIKKCKSEYSHLLGITKNIEKDLTESKDNLKDDTYYKILNLANHSYKIKNHYELKKAKYFSENKDLHKIIKSRKKLDNKMLELMDELEKDILSH